MSLVKPSKQYAMTVVPHRPIRRVVTISALSITVLLFIIGSFYGGRYYAVGNASSVDAERNELREKYSEKVAQVSKLEQQVANLKLAAEVDRKANDEVRAEVVQLKEQLNELEEKNSFYLSVMRPEPGSKGLVVDSPLITSADAPGVYKYNLVIKQIVTKHRKVSGYLEFEILGNQGDALVRLALKDVSKTVNTERIKLSFKYFQRIEGEMALPEGFVPKRLEIKVVAQKPSSVTIDKKFGWLLKEG